MKKAIYAGSFDPFTIGHLDILKKSAKLFDEVHIILGINSKKQRAYPINAMGMSKALMEKVAIAKGRNLEDGRTVICRTRYGNVMASRGSVIPLFC